MQSLPKIDYIGFLLASYFAICYSPVQKRFDVILILGSQQTPQNHSFRKLGMIFGPEILYSSLELE